MVEFMVLGIVVVNLFVSAYVAWRVPQVLSGPFVRVLGEKDSGGNLDFLSVVGFFQMVLVGE